MIYVNTLLKVADNTGAKKILCIRILNCANRSYAIVGDTIIGVVKQCMPNMTITRSEIIRAVIVRTKNCIRRPNGFWIQFDDNAVVLVNKDGSPRGTRVFGPIAKEIRETADMRILSLASEVL
uniref:Large ribosomal subunit protein uL14c n=1 Tax=Pedobesia claviformis TaxID=2364088 RepID=A0A386B0U3_9CHLO|nr:ribosomal protein L14 [Pedobesia claviformis]AYC65314.1 ribosomal protein L14 [Pedobesia claviformis]